MDLAVVKYNYRVLVVVDWIIGVHLSGEIINKLGEGLSVETPINYFDM